jgi:hypothetical protein
VADGGALRKVVSGVMVRGERAVIDSALGARPVTQ